LAAAAAASASSTFSCLLQTLGDQRPQQHLDDGAHQLLVPGAQLAFDTMRHEVGWQP
jgi:hypothetical protein